MYLHAIGATLVKDKVYFTSCDFNALFCMDLKEKRIEYKTCFEAYSKWTIELYEKQILYEGKIYFIPRNCNKVAVYDIKTERMNYIEVPEKGEEVIRDAFIEDGCLWMLYARCPIKIFKVNLTTCKHEIINVEWKCSKEDVVHHAKKIGDNWWMFVRNKGCLINYNWKKNKIKKIQYIKNLENKYFQSDIQEQAWVMPKDENRILEYDYNSGGEKWIYLPEMNQFSSGVVKVILYDGYVVALKSEGMALINRKTDAIKYYRFSMEKLLSNYVIYNNKMILFPAQGKRLLVLDISGESVSEYDFEWDEKLTGESMEKFFMGNLSERMCSLSSFGELIGSNDRQNSNSGKGNGSNIWNVLQNEAETE